MALDTRINWWYVVPGSMIFLPILLKKSFFQTNLLASLLIVMLIGAGTHLFYRFYYYCVVRSVPRKSMAFLDFKLKKELRRRDFKPRDTARVFNYFLGAHEGWEKKQLEKYEQLLTFIGCVIIACGFGMIQVMTHTSFLMKYYILFTVFALLNFTVMWDQVNEYERLTAMVNLPVMVKEIKKKKLLWD